MMLLMNTKKKNPLEYEKEEKRKDDHLTYLHLDILSDQFYQPNHDNIPFIFIIIIIIIIIIAGGLLLNFLWFWFSLQ